jgi:hypothetical protein
MENNFLKKIRNTWTSDKYMQLNSVVNMNKSSHFSFAQAPQQHQNPIASSVEKAAQTVTDNVTDAAMDAMGLQAEEQTVNNFEHRAEDYIAKRLRI